MALRSERERSKMQEKYQMILSQMLKEDDNRFCVDCDTKSPRWASWNLGIFICIRCAGFHRNLGVHISRVKSVNLDSWTAEQIASMQAMGNNRARAVYEANLPAGFRRPQADSALEAFIRAKYEQRKWIEKEWIPPEIMVSSDLIESESNTRRNEPVSDVGQKEKSTSNSIPKLKGFPAPTSTNVSVRQSGNDRPGPNVSVPSITTPVAISKVETPPDLLGLDEPTLPKSSVSINGSATTVNSTANFIDPLQELFSTPTVNTVLTTNNENPNSFTDLNKDLESAFTTPSNPTANTGGVMTTEKIMALYNTPSSSMKPSSSGINLNFSAIQPVHQQQQHSSLLAHQKSASFGGNLYPQQASVPQHGNNFPVRPQYPTNTLAYPSQSGMPQMTHPNAYAMSTPTLQSPASNFNQDQLTNQFSQFVPFANSKTNTAASTLISGMPTRPVTDMMPATSDLLWQ